jgi:hypothetical protein
MAAVAVRKKVVKRPSPRSDVFVAFVDVDVAAVVADEVSEVFVYVVDGGSRGGSAKDRQKDKHVNTESERKRERE